MYVDKCSLTTVFLLNHQVKDYLTDQTANSNQCYWRKYAQTMSISKQGITSVGEIGAKDRFSLGPK